MLTEAAPEHKVNALQGLTTSGLGRHANGYVGYNSIRLRAKVALTTMGEVFWKAFADTAVKTISFFALCILTLSAYLANDKLSELQKTGDSVRKIETQMAALIVSLSAIDKTLLDHDRRLGKLEDWRIGNGWGKP